MGKRVTMDSVVVLNGKSWEINARPSGCYLEILERIQSQLDAMLSYYSRVLVVNLVIRQREYTGDNEPMRAFMAKLKKRLRSSRYRMECFGYEWVREVGKAGQPQHYHLMLFLDGHKVRRAWGISQVANRIADRWDWPGVGVPPRRPERLVTRDDADAYRAAIYHLSYFAKVRTKGDRAPTANDHGGSRLRPKPADGGEGVA